MVNIRDLSPTLNSLNSCIVNTKENKKLKTKLN